MQAMIEALAVAGDESVVEDAVEGMLHAGERLGGVVVLVVDVEIAVAHGLAGLVGEQIVVDEGLGCLAGEFHHHAGGRVGVHVGVLARDVVVLGLDDFQEDVACLGAACDAALVAVGDVFLGHFLAGALHELELHAVLDLLHGHGGFAGHGDAVGDFVDEGLVLAELGLEHGFADGGLDFFFVEAHNASVAFDNGLNHLGDKVLRC